MSPNKKTWQKHGFWALYQEKVSGKLVYTNCHHLPGFSLLPKHVHLLGIVDLQTKTQFLDQNINPEATDICIL